MKKNTSHMCSTVEVVTGIFMAIREKQTGKINFGEGKHGKMLEICSRLEHQIIFRFPTLKTSETGRGVLDQNLLGNRRPKLQCVLPY